MQREYPLLAVFSVEQRRNLSNVLRFTYFSYFPKNSTQEILDEIYPKLYPLDTGKICGAFDLLAIFLNPMQGYELWLDDLINLWNTYHNPSWNEVSTEQLVTVAPIQKDADLNRGHLFPP